MSTLGIDSKIEDKIEELLRTLRHYNATSEEYAQIVDQIVKLKGSLTPPEADRSSPKSWP